VRGNGTDDGRQGWPADYVKAERGGSAAGIFFGSGLSTPGGLLIIAVAIAGLVMGVAGWIKGDAAQTAAANLADTARAAIEAAQAAASAAAVANDRSSQARMEARLAQEDLIMLRAAVRARGITVETAGDHE
jgi:Na+/melibiose symporter-like transporter